MDKQWRMYTPYHSPMDPCPPLSPKYYVVPPNQYVVVQPKALRQFAPREALRRGTLWPDLFSPYQSPYSDGGS